MLFIYLTVHTRLAENDTTSLLDLFYCIYLMSDESRFVIETGLLKMAARQIYNLQ